jgi:hypothetical protein
MEVWSCNAAVIEGVRFKRRDAKACQVWVLSQLPLLVNGQVKV